MEMALAVFYYRPAASPLARHWGGSWWGLPLVVASVAVHMAGQFFFIDWLSAVSFLLVLMALCLCVGGWQLARLAGPSIGYLAFMLPLPFFVEVALANPLQRLATVVCTYLLQTLGFAASADGNIIVLNNGPIFVADACSGLGMMVTFFALATAVAIVIKRPLLDKLVVAVSAVPVAVLANIVRITVTGILFETAGSRVGQFIYHDVTGLLVMMPIALVLIWLELKVLSHLLVEPPPQAPTEIGLNLGPSAPPAPTGRKKNKHAIVQVGDGEVPRPVSGNGGNPLNNSARPTRR